MNNLLEASRSQLLNKSKRADVVKSYNSTRYDRRNNQSIINSISSYNNIDFNELFRANSITIKLPIQGETDKYEVTIFFNKVCDEIKREVKLNNNKLEFKCIFKALFTLLNRENIYINCTCPDWTYRQSFYGTMQNYNSGKAENRPPKITNPRDSKGAGCKHIMCVLGNLDWAMKVATAINNYISYIEKNREPLYNKFIEPKIFDNVEPDIRDIEDDIEGEEEN